jgi:hypothetical protein
MQSVEKQDGRMTCAGKSSDLADHWILRMFGNRRPLAFDAGDSNLYRYAGNKPTNATDPSGLELYSPSYTPQFFPQQYTENIGPGFGRFFFLTCRRDQVSVLRQAMRDASLMIRRANAALQRWDDIDRQTVGVGLRNTPSFVILNDPQRRQVYVQRFRDLLAAVTSQTPRVRFEFEWMGAPLFASRDTAAWVNFNGDNEATGNMIHLTSIFFNPSMEGRKP